MKTDLQKLIMIVWLAGSIFILYEIWANVSYIADMIEGYMRMLLSEIKK